MTDRMRILELCLKESAFAFDWLAKGNCMSCTRGYLSFMLFVASEENGIAFQLTYRYSAFDRIYHELTSANIFPGTRIIESVQPVSAWSLMGVSGDMRRLAEKVDKVADELSNRIITPKDNLKFLKSFKAHHPLVSIANEEMLSALAMGDNAAALAVANECLLSGQYGDGLCTRVSDYIKYRT
ncbi:MAG: hypothetical protein IKM04_02670 [Clostridia bacterium]|nr:hypothetical protein [Clostridia bacterium]